MKNVWIVMDAYEETGPSSIKGVFNSENEARWFISDYVLKEDIETGFLGLTKHEIKEESK